MLMAGFEPGSSDVGNDCSANCATTKSPIAANLASYYCCDLCGQHFGQNTFKTLFLTIEFSLSTLPYLPTYLPTYLRSSFSWSAHIFPKRLSVFMSHKKYFFLLWTNLLLLLGYNSLRECSFRETSTPLSCCSQLIFLNVASDRQIHRFDDITKMDRLQSCQNKPLGGQHRWLLQQRQHQNVV